MPAGGGNVDTVRSCAYRSQQRHHRGHRGVRRRSCPRPRSGPRRPGRSSARSARRTIWQQFGVGDQVRLIEVDTLGLLPAGWASAAGASDNAGGIQLFSQIVTALLA